MMCVEDHGEEFVGHTSTLSSKNMRSLASAVTRVVAILCWTFSCLAVVMPVSCDKALGLCKGNPARGRASEGSCGISCVAMSGATMGKIVGNRRCSRSGRAMSSFVTN